MQAAQAQSLSPTLRTGTIEDAEECGRIMFEAFRTIGPPDFPSVAVATLAARMLLSQPSSRMPAHQPGKSSTSFLRSRSATLTPEPLIIARLSSFWSGIHDDGKDVDIEVAPNHSTARQRLSLGEDCS